MIRLTGINKTFKVAKRNPGLSQAVKALFSRETQTVYALSDVSFTVGNGEMVGYIGPNGAGKSTTIKIMCGVLTPDSGLCEINGRVPWKERVDHAREIGVVFGQRSQLWWDVPVIDSLELIKSIYKVPLENYKRNLSELTDLLDLSELLKTPARSLSLGQRMRCEIAASLLHDPKILFLDEPTIGLDAISKIAARQFIKRLNAEKKTTVILTTHDMQDIEALTERIILIGKGHILLDSNMRELKARISGFKTLTIEYSGPAPMPHPEWLVLDSREGRLSLRFDARKFPVADAISYLSGSSCSANTNIQDISVSGITAEEMAAGLYKEFNI